MFIHRNFGAVAPTIIISCFVSGLEYLGLCVNRRETLLLKRAWRSPEEGAEMVRMVCGDLPSLGLLSLESIGLAQTLRDPKCHYSSLIKVGSFE